MGGDVDPIPKVHILEDGGEIIGFIVPSMLKRWGNFDPHYP
jgi:hypothetical protein